MLFIKKAYRGPSRNRASQTEPLVDAKMSAFSPRIGGDILWVAAQQLGRVDTRNLTQRREDLIIALLFPIFTPSFPRKRESRGLGTAFARCPSHWIPYFASRERDMSTRPSPASAAVFPYQTPKW